MWRHHFFWTAVRGADPLDRQAQKLSERVKNFGRYKQLVLEEVYNQGIIISCYNLTAFNSCEGDRLPG